MITATGSDLLEYRAGRFGREDAGSGSAFAAPGLGPEERGSFGVSPGEAGIEEDWHGGSRRLKK
jgi:hypothetical protein